METRFKINGFIHYLWSEVLSDVIVNSVSSLHHLKYIMQGKPLPNDFVQIKVQSSKENRYLILQETNTKVWIYVIHCCLHMRAG